MNEMNKTHGIAALLGALAGGLATYLVSADGRPAPISAPSTSAPPQVMNGEFASSTPPSSASSAPADSPTSTPPAAASEENRQAQWEERRQAFRQTAMEQRLSLLDTRLRLSPEQVASYKAWIQDPSMSPRAIEDALAALLSPEQKTEFEKTRQEEWKTVAEARASSELVRIQSMVSLDERQKELFFQNYASLQLTTLQEGESDQSFGSDRWRGRSEQRAKALEGVLSPTQMESYTKAAQQWEERRGKASERPPPKP